LTSNGKENDSRISPSNWRPKR